MSFRNRTLSMALQSWGVCVHVRAGGGGGGKSLSFSSVLEVIFYFHSHVLSLCFSTQAVVSPVVVCFAS
jgi:hypothetical protein